MGSWRPWQRSRQTRPQRSLTSSSSAAMGFTAPRATAAAAKSSAAATAAATTAAAETTRTFWWMGTIARLFSLRLARTLLCRMSSRTSRTTKRMSPSTIQYPAARSSSQLLCDFSWRLRIFFGRIRTPNAHAASPARNAGTFRFVLELLDRAGRDDSVLSPRRVCEFEWICV